MSAQPRVTAYAHAVHPNGGMERAQREVVIGLLARDWRVRVVARETQLPAHELLEVVRVRVPRRPAPLEQLAFAARAPRFGPGADEIVTALGAIVVWPVDVVIVQYVNAAARGLRGSNASFPRRVNSAINHEVAVAMERWCYRPGRVWRFLPVSSALRDGLAAVSDRGAAPSVVVPNGVDPSQFAPDAAARARVRAAHGVAPGARLAVFVGGDWERKGLRFAVAALAAAPEWHLLVVGPGMAEPFRDEARRAGTGERLHFAGESRDPAALLAAGDAFVLPTGYEGFPLAAIEAASTGLALLLTRESNADGLLKPGETGFWIQRDGESIAARLSDLDDAALREGVGASARRVAAAYAWPQIVDRHIAVYSEILASRAEESPRRKRARRTPRRD